TSGKGGVGKTNIVANLAYALCQMRKKVLILDADLGLGNLDIFLDLDPRFNLQHVIYGTKSIEDIIVTGPGGMKIIPASSGVTELTMLSKEQQISLLSQFDSLYDDIDILLIDTAAGISSNVIYFNIAASETIVVVSPEPTSITDAYALMKVLSTKHSKKHFKLVTNYVTGEKEGYGIYERLNLVTDRFLNISLDYLGYISVDKNFTKAVRQKKLIQDLYPDSMASKCFDHLAKAVCELPATPSNDNIQFFWRNFFAHENEYVR
ncbi:MAG: MinD/ParA family protein, partial [Thermodesulfobacteriota bacterium]|nr:MinD/ParA family protein [Thermodesulfobacteriota bacterium]